MTAITGLANEVYSILSITEEKPQKAYNQFKKWAVSNNFNLDFRKLDSWKLVLKNLTHQEVKTEEVEPEVNDLVEQSEEFVKMTLKEVKAEIKRFKEEGLTNVKLNANAKILVQTLSELIGKTVEVV